MSQPSATPDEIDKLKRMFRNASAGTGYMSRGALWTILTAVGCDKGAVTTILDATATTKDGLIDICSFLDWLYCGHPDDTSDEKAAITPEKIGPLFFASLNFLGNAYNPMEFMNGDEAFEKNYSPIREALASVTKDDVVKEVLALGYPPSIADLLPEEKVEKNFTKDFLKNDNKMELALRTNMVVAGMMPTDAGPPLYHEVSAWRERMAGQTDNYAKELELVAWDIACNLSCEKAQAEYVSLCQASYLNPALILNNLQILLDGLPSSNVEETREVVCAVQEFPEHGSAKYIALLGDLPNRDLKHIMAEGINSSVAFIVSRSVTVERSIQSPLGVDVNEVLAAIGQPEAEPVGQKDMESLKTTARKTILMDIAATPRRPALRAISAHAKEFKTNEGTRLLARYLRAVIGHLEDRAGMVMLDSNTADAEKSMIFDQSCREFGFEVLSPAGHYTSTRKMRSEMHGQFYDQKKCLKVSEAHKTFVLLAQPQSKPIWESKRHVAIKPDLRADVDQRLPNRSWPTDHCMLFGELTACST